MVVGNNNKKDKLISLSFFCGEEWTYFELFQVRFGTFE
jgi:hypothetical protein